MLYVFIYKYALVTNTHYMYYAYWNYDHHYSVCTAAARGGTDRAAPKAIKALVAVSTSCPSACWKACTMRLLNRYWYKWYRR